MCLPIRLCGCARPAGRRRGAECFRARDVKSVRRILRSNRTSAVRWFLSTGARSVAPAKLDLFAGDHDARGLVANRLGGPKRNVALHCDWVAVPQLSVPVLAGPLGTRFITAPPAQTRNATSGERVRDRQSYGSAPPAATSDVHSLHAPQRVPVTSQQTSGVAVTPTAGRRPSFSRSATTHGLACSSLPDCPAVVVFGSPGGFTSASTIRLIGSPDQNGRVAHDCLAEILCSISSYIIVGGSGFALPSVRRRTWASRAGNGSAAVATRDGWKPRRSFTSCGVLEPPSSNQIVLTRH